MARQRYQRGCVFQRGTRRKVWVGRWRERVIRADGTIGQIQKSVVLGRVADLPTRRLAQAVLDERVGPINRGLHVPQSVATFGAFAERDWKRLVLPTLKLSTQRSYRMMLQKHVGPYWGEWRLCDITKIDVQQFVLHKFDQQLAWQTVRNAWIVLSSILDAAMDYGALAVNPARGVKFPLAPPRTAPRILGREDVGALLQQVDEPYRTMIGLVALTGLRIGELLGLRWRGLDLISDPRRSGLCGRFRSGLTPCRCSPRIGHDRRERRRTSWSSPTRRAIRSGNRRYSHACCNRPPNGRDSDASRGISSATCIRHS
jgi:integrase